MRNHKKLYRSITASLLMLLAGLVLAPTVVTASFLSSGKKPEAPAVQQVALEPSKPKAVPRAHSIRFAEPTVPASSARGQDEQPVPQAETESNGANQHDSAGLTTFAVSDFEPTHGGGAVFPRGAVGLAVADASGSNISKVARKPNSPQTETNNAGKGQPDTSGASDNKPSDTPAPGGDKKDQTVADGGQPSNQPPSTGVVGNGDNLENRPHASVPEPSSLGLLAVGILGLALARRRG